MRNLAVFVVVAGAIAAQPVAVPSGLTGNEGSTNNTIPWWNVSNTYQQIHDANDVAAAFNSATPLLTAISFRKDGSLSGAVTGRSLEVQVSLGTTTVAPGAMTNTFATNIGPTPTIVVPYTVVNLPALTNQSIPNPVGWTVPFTTPYSYASALGHLCWEWRHKNASVWPFEGMDAWSPTSSVVYPNLGAGCVATGQTLPAQIGTRSLAISTGIYRNVLSRAAASTPAVLFIGIAPQQITLPGLCSSLEFLPVADVPGLTTAAGGWDLSLTFGSLVGRGQAHLYAQFVFFDAPLPWGVGLSNATHMAAPPGGLGTCSRIWAGGSNAGAGFETATIGTVGMDYGLVTIFN